MEYLNKLTDYQEKSALCFYQTEYSYQDLTNKIDDYFSNQLDQVSAGDMVTIISDYSFEAIALFFALYKKKCVIVPIVSTNPVEIKNREDVVQPDIRITFDNGELVISKYHYLVAERHSLIQNIKALEHSGLILFSSGSTGTPKAMIHDLDVLIDTYKDKRSKNLAIMVFLMFDHIGGLNTLLNSLAMGAKIVLPCKREPEHVAELIEREKVNLLPASPTFLNMMLIAGVETKFNLGSLRMITYGTEAMPESLLHRLKKSLPRVKLLQTFGTSETGIAQTSSRSSSSLEIRIDDPNQEYKVINGELWLRSKTQILGYLNHDMDSFSDDGWFQTGDLVEEKDGGYLKIIGRKKEVINVGGEKVLPSEVESVVLELADIDDCVAFSAPNAITGQTVAINIVTKDSVDTKLLKKQIRKHCLSKLDSYKVPTKINFTVNASVSERFKKVRHNLS